MVDWTGVVDLFSAEIDLTRSAAFLVSGWPPFIIYTKLQYFTLGGKQIREVIAND